MKQKHIKLTQDEVHMLLLYAMRYSMGRKTYAPFEVSNLIKKYKNKLTPSHLDLIQKDLLSELNWHEGNGEYLGHEIDHKEWKSLSEELECELKYKSE